MKWLISAGLFSVGFFLSPDTTDFFFKLGEPIFFALDVNRKRATECDDDPADGCLQFGGVVEGNGPENEMS